jgi:hypothetical protein
MDSVSSNNNEVSKKLGSNVKKRLFVELKTLNNSEEFMSKVDELLKLANEKDKGREILFTDLAVAGIGKLTSKDIKRIQQESLTNEDKLAIACEKYNKKNGTTLSIIDFAAAQLKLQ